MSTNEAPTIYILKEETNAMGAAQIMLGLIHNALGILWFSLHRLEEKKHSIGLKLMLTSIYYLFVSGSLRVLAIITNTLSIFTALFGSMLFGYEFPVFELMGIDYIWSNMAGMMLLQISVICTMSELVIAIIVLHWFVTSKIIRPPSGGSPFHSELSPPPPSKPPSLLELENVSEESQTMEIEDEED